MLDGGHAPGHLDGATLVVSSPGVPPRAEILVWARERGIPVWGEMELGARLAGRPYLAVTGTNGKTTTTGMLAACCARPAWTPSPAATSGTRSRPRPASRTTRSSSRCRRSSSRRRRRSTRGSRCCSTSRRTTSTGTGRSTRTRRPRRGSSRSKVRGDVHVGNLDDEAAAAISRSAPCEVRWFTVGEPVDDGAGFGDGRLTAGWSDADLGALTVDTPAMRADAAAAATAALAFGVGRRLDRRRHRVVRARTPPGRVGGHRRRGVGSSTTRRRRTRTRRSPPSARPTGSS